MDKDSEPLPQEESPLNKPALSFESITFSDESQLTFEEDEIIVFVGPNNAGKSAALRELEENISHTGKRTIIHDVVIRKAGTAEDLRTYLKSSAVLTGPLGQRQYSGYRFAIHESHVGHFDSTKRGPVATFFAMRLATETRITDSNSAGAIALYETAPQHPIHLLAEDDAVEERISGYFRKAFGDDLIVFRAGGGQMPLLVGERPGFQSGEHPLKKSYVDRLRQATVPLQEQGDGMRSFASVILNTLAVETQSVIFLDEPEAFLHPPQARLLGEFIANERRSTGQLFIATHSPDILQGLLADRTRKVRIIRIQRAGQTNRVKELDKAQTEAIARDTLTKYSRVLDGIFHKHVIICESDADCLFYNSMLDLPDITSGERPDVLFIHASGKHRMARLASMLRSLDVPVSIIADIDVLNDEETFKNLLTTIGGDWLAIKSHWRALKQAVEEQNPPMKSVEVAASIREVLDSLPDVAAFPKESEREIKNFFRASSPWSALKRGGRASLPRGQATQHFDAIATASAASGLWIVPVGELEGFCKSVEAVHGPAWVEKVLESRNLADDIELAQARDFVTEIWNAADR